MKTRDTTLAIVAVVLLTMSACATDVSGGYAPFALPDASLMDAQPDAAVAPDTSTSPDAGHNTDAPESQDITSEPDTTTDPDTAADPDAASDADTATDPDAASEPDTTAPPDTAENPEDPTFPHLNAVIDIARGSAPAWATFVHTVHPTKPLKFRQVHYKDTGSKLDFWPASVIKIYPALAALILIKQLGISLDANATLYRRKGTGAWVKDITRSVRAMIHGSFNCSSNTDYTLLLRLAGVDWLHKTLFVPKNGFEETSLMVGYSSDRPYVYYRTEEQRIVLVDKAKTVERKHSWAGTMHSKVVGCGVSYSSTGAANCSSTRDMAENIRRIAYHEHLPATEQFSVRKDDLDWLRYGGKTLQMSNKNCSAAWGGIKKVFPDADLLHKGGNISTYALGVHHVKDKATGVQYALGAATKSGTKTAIIRISE